MCEQALHLFSLNVTCLKHAESGTGRVQGISLYSLQIIMAGLPSTQNVSLVGQYKSTIRFCLISETLTDAPKIYLILGERTEKRLINTICIYVEIYKIKSNDDYLMTFDA